jgi:glycine/D-amino acid oxidase-like deaminating enzyme
MQDINIIGCGVVGAAIAYKLSKTNRETHQGVRIRAFEANPAPAMGATGASLGLLMGACSSKAKGDLVSLRLASLRMYDRLIDELIAQTNLPILYNRQGILNFYRSPVISKMRSLVEIRETQGFALHWLERSEILASFPKFQADGALFSPCDRAVHPVQLVNALVAAATQNGVQFHWQTPIQDLETLVMGDRADVAADVTVIASGMGSNALVANFFEKPVNADAPSADLLHPVGGQALRVRVPDLNLAAIIHAENPDESYEILNDFNIVPLGNDHYWLGATVEFERSPIPNNENVALLLDAAKFWCPAFAKAEVMETWAGDRPRPEAAKAPIIGFLSTQPQLLLATGHYRNGVMMAPVTAQIVSDLIWQGSSDLPWQSFAPIVKNRNECSDRL